MNGAKLTVRLPQADLGFAKAYARDHGFSLTALIHRYLGRLRSAAASPVPPEVTGIAGLVPPETNARDAYIRHSERRHR